MYPLEVHERPYILLWLVDLRHKLQCTAPEVGKHHKGMPTVSYIGQFMVDGPLLTMTSVEYCIFCPGVAYAKVYGLHLIVSYPALERIRIVGQDVCKLKRMSRRTENARISDPCAWRGASLLLEELL